MFLARHSRSFGLIRFTALLTIASASVAQQRPAQAGGAGGEGGTARPPATMVSVPDSTTEGTVTLAGGQKLDYRAVAGTITVGGTDQQDSTMGFDGKPLPDSGIAPASGVDAPPTARMFYVAYFKKDGDAHRPVVFAYNGGPGSPTMWLHMGTFGPKRIVTPDTKHQEGAPYTLVNNEDSLLDVADVVFIDAPGTGLSRTFGRNRGEAFYGVDADGHAFERFIRRFLSKYDRWNSPKYLFGESYGTPRSAVLAADLGNVDLNGVILLSQILAFDNSVDGPTANPSVDQAYALGLPTMAATAWYHHKLSPQPPALKPFLEEVQKFALGEYMTALLQGSELSEEKKKAVAVKLHSYIGLPVDYLIKSDLRVVGGAFSKELKADEGISVGRLDTRYEGPDMDPLGPNTGYDPQSDAITSAWNTAINEYLHDELKYASQDTYLLSGRTGGDFNWNMTHRPPGRGGFGGGGGGAAGTVETGANVMPDLAYRMKLNPKMKVFLAGGYYDLATPYFEGIFEMHHLPMPNSLQSNISYHYYEAGHMIYVREDILKQFHNDVAAFIKSSENGAK
jgi:carboxypeptidase C (cathepsin A)